MEMSVKLFGVALDALDDPERVALKQAYIEASATGRLRPGMPLDPYDAISPIIAQRLAGSIELCGKLDLPGWLTPRPPVEDAHLVDSVRYREFIDNDEIRTWAEECSRFVERVILPDVPCMIAVDHAMTAGPLRALASRHDPRETAVVIIDSHFDAIPAGHRALSKKHLPCGAANCGSFLAGLLDERVILPENLFVAGVSDYPIPGVADVYRKAYNSFINRGVTVIPKIEADGSALIEKLEYALQRSDCSRLYVSLDADAGACMCMNAVRFMDTEGLDEETIIGLARMMRELLNSDRFEIAGLDVVEVDVHLLDLADIDGAPDRTRRICADFITTLLGKDI